MGILNFQGLEFTGWCWKCGRAINIGLFCAKPKKCQEQYEKKQDSQIIKSKRAGYGITGSTH